MRQAEPSDHLPFPRTNSVTSPRARSRHLPYWHACGSTTYTGTNLRDTFFDRFLSPFDPRVSYNHPDAYSHVKTHVPNPSLASHPQLAILDTQTSSPHLGIASRPVPPHFPTPLRSRETTSPLGSASAGSEPFVVPRTYLGHISGTLGRIQSKLATPLNQRFLEIEIPNFPRKLFLDIPNGPPRILCIELYPLTYVPPAPPPTPTRPIAGCESNHHRLPEGYDHLVQRCRYNFFYSAFFHQGSRYQHHSSIRPRLLPRSANNPAPVPLTIEAPPVNEIAVPLFDFSRDIFYDDPWRDPDVHFAPLKRTRSESPEPLASSSRRRLD
ncbi:hypothetical protein SCHPADRAFT_947510 [Schizopora paradoxa]|uniref:Uncharacterized protein n=1 Tax=Schizopora paradoxa TaxID=27342 RepID=A0A0H2QYR0_9AGAM|nr:hypothetical protein SCHPADRAFT_947510 [Schizopora paradoxa]